MRKNYYAPIRRRADGSVFIDKNIYLKEFLGLTAAVILLTLFFTAIVMFALISPFDVQAQSAEKFAAVGGPENEEVVTETKVSRDSGINSAKNLPSIFPVSGRLTSGFGYRSNPFGGAVGEFHPGQDIAAPLGTPVSAAADGEVVFAGWQRGYGNIVIINHADGISTRYAHLSKIVVRLKDFVTSGTLIGAVGSTGRSTGAHLHYEVRINNKSVDPANYLPNSEIIK